MVRKDPWRVFKAGGVKDKFKIDRFPPKDSIDKHMFFPSIDLHAF